MNKLLTLSNISKSFDRDRVHALKKISFECDKGDVISIVGSSGSGKSTLLRIIAGLEIPDKGEITLDGNLINDNNTFTSAEKRDCSLVFQDFALFPNMTVIENICFGKKAANNETLIDELMEFTVITDLADRYPHEISGGQQARIVLARSLLSKKPIILMDEPVSSLDDETRVKTLKVIKKNILKHNMTLLLVSHNIQDRKILSARKIKLD